MNKHRYHHLPWLSLPLTLSVTIRVQASNQAEQAPIIAQEMVP